MKWKEKVDEAAEKLYDLVKSEKYDIEVNIPKKGEKAVHVHPSFRFFYYNWYIPDSQLKKIKDSIHKQMMQVQILLPIPINRIHFLDIFN